MKHIFFDLDRTLWDFETNSQNALHQLYENENLGDSIRSFQSFHTKYKKINAELWNLYGKGKLPKDKLRVKRFRDTLLHFGIDNKELSEKLSTDYVKISPFQTELFPNTHETLTWLRNNDYILHVITNGFKEVQHIKLNQSKLKDYFDVVLCSEEVGKTKPAKEVFQHALQLANAKNDKSIMIGDDYRVDVIGAERQGIQGVLFDPHQYHKFGTHEWHIKNLDEIPALLPWMEKTRL